MRITTQMLAAESRKSGIPLAQGTLLDALNKQDTSVNLADILNKNKSAKGTTALQENYMELQSAAAGLEKYASQLGSEKEDSLFGKESEIKDIISNIQDMAEAYNQTLKLLQSAEGSLNSFYLKELKKTTADNAELLKSVGITQEKDGSLSVDKKVLENTDYDKLKETFGSESDFIKRTEYISGRVSENAAASVLSISNQYNAKGASCSDTFLANKYNFFG